MSGILYQLLLLTLKLLGVKKTFSQDPIDYQKLRKEDVHLPPKKIRKNYQFEVADTTVTQIEPAKNTLDNFLILYCPGGAFVAGPGKHHWANLYKIVKQTKVKAWLLDYPKAPEHTIEQITQNIDAVYAKALEQYSAANIIVMGDSAGANLMLTLIQRLVKNKEAVPGKLIGITPVFDSSMSNPAIEAIDKLDPMLSKQGVLSAKKMCAGTMELTHPDISPLYGSFASFPSTLLFIGGRDIMYPDAKVAIMQMKKEGLNPEVSDERRMPHIWALLPVIKEAKTALNQMISSIEEFVETYRK